MEEQLNGGLEAVPTETAQPSNQQEGIPIRFNHEQVMLSREEAARLAQLGKFAEGKEELLRGAQELYRQSGYQDPGQWLDTIRQQAQNREMPEPSGPNQGAQDAEELRRLKEVEEQFYALRASQEAFSSLVEQMQQLKQKYPDLDLNALPPEMAAYQTQYKVPAVVAYENAVLLPAALAEQERAKQEEKNAHLSAGSARSNGYDQAVDEFERQWQQGQGRA